MPCERANAIAARFKGVQSSSRIRREEESTRGQGDPPEADLQQGTRGTRGDTDEDWGTGGRRKEEVTRGAAVEEAGDGWGEVDLMIREEAAGEGLVARQGGDGGRGQGQLADAGTTPTPPTADGKLLV
jgi:hypothetical protein